MVKMLPTLAKQMIKTIKNDSLREFWSNHFPQEVTAEPDNFIKLYLEYYNSNNDNKLSSQQEKSITVFLKSEFEDDVCLLKFQLMLEGKDLNSKIQEILSICDEKSNQNLDDEQIEKMNNRYFISSGKNAKEFWNKYYIDKLYVDFEDFFENFKDFIISLEGENKYNLSKTDFDKLYEELKKPNRLVPGEKVSSEKFASLFQKQNILADLRNILKVLNFDVVKPQKGEFDDVNWDFKDKGALVSLSIDKKTLVSAGTRFISVISEQSFNKGIHYVELHLDKLDKNLFLGVALNRKINFEGCPRNNEQIWALGPGEVINDPINKIILEKDFKDVSKELKESNDIGFIFDFDKKMISICYGSVIRPFLEITSEIPLHIFASSKERTTITITKYKVLNDQNDKDDFIQRLKLPNNNYKPSPFVLSNGKYEGITWSSISERKGSKIELLNQNKTAIKDRSVIYNCILSEQVFCSPERVKEITEEDENKEIINKATFKKEEERSHLHYVEFYLQKCDGLYLGIGSSDSNEIDCEVKVRETERVCVVGNHIICNRFIGKSIGLSGQIKLKKKTFVGFLIDMEKHEAYFIDFREDPETKVPTPHKQIVFSKLTNQVRIFACLSKHNIITFSKYINNEEHIQDYLQNRKNERIFSHILFKPLFMGDKSLKKVRWSQINCDKKLLVSTNQKQLKRITKGSYSSALSDHHFEDGVHFVELYIEKSNDTTFIGIAQKNHRSKGNSLHSPLSLNEQPNSDELIWAVGGKSIICNQIAKVDNSDFFNKDFVFRNNMKIGLIIDLEKFELIFVIENKKYLAFTGIPNEVNLFVSTANQLTLTITKYLNSYKKIDKHLNKNKNKGVGEQSHSACWSNKWKAETTVVDKDKKLSVYFGSFPASIALSQKVLTNGIHLIEFTIDQIDGNIYLGIAQFEKIKTINFKQCPKANNSGVWALGPSIISNSPDDISEEIKDDSLFGETMTITMIVDIEKKEVRYLYGKGGKPVLVFNNFSDIVVLFLCSIGHSIASITNYLHDKKEIEKYLSQEKKADYQASPWVIEAKKEINENHPLQKHMEKLKEKKQREKVKFDRINRRKAALNNLNEENFKWWIQNFSTDLKVNSDIFNQKISDYLEKKFDLHFSVLNVFITFMEDHLNGNSSENVTTEEFKEYFDDSQTKQNIPILSFFSKTEQKLLEINKANFEEEKLTPLHVYCISPNLKENSFFKLTENFKEEDLNKKDFDGRTPLHYALENNLSFNIISQLVQKKANINEQDNNGFTPLYISCCTDKTKLESINFLVENKADTNLLNQNSVSPLYSACLKNIQIDKIKFLIDSGAKLEYSTDKNFSVLFAACSNEVNFEKMKLLVESKADVNYKDDDNVTPLGEAFMNHVDLEKVRYLVESKADINYCRHKDGTTFLTMSCLKELDIEVLKFLIDSKSVINKENSLNPLFAACLSNLEQEKLELLINHKADVNLGYRGYTPLIVACQNNINLATFRLLVNNKADINLGDKSGLSPLEIGCQSNLDMEKIQFLIDNKANINQKESGNSLLFAFIKSNEADKVEMLINNKADVNLCSDGNSPLFFACQNNNDLKIIQILVNHKADINFIKNGTSPLGIGCQNNMDIEKIQFLINNKAEINSENGSPPLYLSCMMNIPVEKIQILINNKADVNHPNRQGLSPLFISCSRNIDLQTIQLLVNHKADINLEIHEMTPFVNGCIANMDTEKIRFLVENKADINYLDQYGNTILHSLSNHFNQNSISYLLELGLNPKQENCDGWSFYEILKHTNNEKILSSFDFGKYNVVNSSITNSFYDKNEIQKCFKEGKCTFNYTGEETPVYQFMRNCGTCDEYEQLVCEYCFKNCHKDHELSNLTIYTLTCCACEMCKN